MQRLHHRLLYNILGTYAVTLEPHGEAEQAIGMRRYGLFERSRSLDIVAQSEHEMFSADRQRYCWANG